MSDFREQNQPTDLGAPSDSVLEGVIEVLGEERVEEIEQLYTLATSLAEFSRLPNPFDGRLTQYTPLITSEVRHSMAEVERADALQDVPVTEISDITRPQGKILQESAKLHRSHILKSYKNSRVEIESVRFETDRLLEGPKEDNPEQIASSLPSLYERLEAAAVGMPARQHVEDFKTILDVEGATADLDACAVALDKHPDLRQKYYDLFAEAVKARSNRRQSQAKLDEYVGLKIELIKKGERNWKVRRAHRSTIKIGIDGEIAKNSEKALGEMIDYGGRIHAALVEAAKLAAEQPIIDSLKCLAIISRLLEGVDLVTLATEENVDPAVLVSTEAYIATRTEELENAARQVNLKLSSESRGVIHRMKDTPLQRAKRLQQESESPAELDKYREVEADDDFRRMCRDARNIIVGGGRIDYPGAKELADRLHNLKFGTGEDVRLEPEESGLIVGIVTGKINSLLSVLDRLQNSADVEDEQVEKLRLEAPDQFSTLSKFDLELTVARIASILDDVYDRQRLLTAIQNQRAETRVLKTIEALVEGKPINLDDIEASLVASEPTADEPEEEHPVGNGVTSQPDDTPRIVSEELANIAQQLEWQVFPQGARKLADIQRELSGSQIDTRRVNWDRISNLLFLVEQCEGNLYRSADSNLGTKVPYLVAEITVHGHRFAVAECPEIGNATYIVDESNAAGTWDEVMQLTKAEARALGAVRIYHPTEEKHLHKIVERLNSLLAVSA